MLLSVLTANGDIMVTYPEEARLVIIERRVRQAEKELKPKKLKNK